MNEEKFKNAVRKRDGHKCVRCGMSNESHILSRGKQLHVHRKYPGSVYRADVCETLCEPCHKADPHKVQGQWPPDLELVEQVKCQFRASHELIEAMTIKADSLNMKLSEYIRWLITADLKRAAKEERQKPS